ncbi:MAG TPA: FKBP-type peptidyl-prolyl cis-trans isomerase [Flavisolibacter sp.]
MQIRQFILVCAAAVLVFASCKQVDFQKTSSGVPYKVFSEGKGDSIKLNYVVQFEVIQKTKDTVLFSSYSQKTPQFMQVQPPPPKVSYADIASNVMEILPKLRKGDSVYITQVSDSILAGNPMAASSRIKKGDQVITTLRITQVYKTVEEATEAVNKERIAKSGEAEKENLAKFRADTAVTRQMAVDNKIIEGHLAANNIQAQKTDWGVYVQVINPGQGPKPTAGQYVSVKYRGTDLAGKEFDAGTYPLQIGLGGSIKGFEEGVKQFGVGGKGKVFVPSMLGYGPTGSAPKIGPNQVLVFELEILDISSKAPMPEGHSKDDGHGH